MTEVTHLEDQIRECFGRAIYTHKTHAKMADRCAAVLSRYKILQIVLSALTASGALTALLADGLVLKILTAAASVATLIVSGYMKGFDPGSAAQKHRDAAASIWPVRESYLSLLTDLRCGLITPEDAGKRRDDLQETLAAIYKGAPQTNARAYADAQKALKESEDYTFSDAEIDRFVPTGLRKAR